MINKNAPFPALTLTTALTSLAMAFAAPAAAQSGGSRAGTLEEVIVTAQKRAETLQEAPISIAAMGEAQLVAQGVTNLSDLGGGVIPSLRIQPFVNSPSTLTIAIRGNGPSDAGQITRESSVAVYIDDVYMSRAQGLAMDVADLERVEVLRGPQGTLFGRNATGGAVRLVSKKPSGEFGLRQQFTVGNFDYFKSATHIDLPEFAGVRTKLDYLHTQKDGWVDNTASGENDFGDLKQDALRFTADWDITDRLNLHYAYDWSEIEATQNYFQLLYDGLGLLGTERHATDKTRFPIRPLDPTETDQQGHALTLTWNASETITIKSITAYRELDEKTRNNYGGVLLSNGLITAADVEQRQFSQEFQIIGETDQLNWIAGLYYYEEDAEEDLLNLASLDMFGILGPPMTPIIPPVPSFSDAPRHVEAETESFAVFGQVSWTPPMQALQNRLEITLGLRYTEDKKKGLRDYPLPELINRGTAFQQFDLKTDSLDPSVTFSFQWTEQLNTYIRWANAYKAAGVNMRSLTFRPYDEETVETWEVGLKSEFWNRRARLNIALFQTDYDDFQIDFSDPLTPTFSETINATHVSEVDGLEVELTVLPLPGLTLNLNYTYLDGDQPYQPNPLNNNIPERFHLSQTPLHAGSLAIDYEFDPFPFGVLSAHLDIISSDRFAFAPKNFDFQDGYTLINGRVTLSDIRLGGDRGRLRLAVWGKNLSDEKYRIYTFPVGNPPLTIPAAYGEPRSYGIEAEYSF